MDHKIKIRNRNKVGPERKTKRKRSENQVMFFLGQIKHNWMTSEQEEKRIGKNVICITHCDGISHDYFVADVSLIFSLVAVS
jgi:hypothetical protein